MKILKEHDADILKQSADLTHTLIYSIRRKNADEVLKKLKNSK